MFMGLYKKKLSMTFLSLAFFFSLIVTGFLFFVMVIVQRDANGEQLRSLLASHSDRLQVSFGLVSDARAKLEADGDLPAVAVDVDQIQHALHNLLDNALVHTPQGGRITLSAVRNSAGKPICGSSASWN